MVAREAATLYMGQRVEFSDGRIATVLQQESNERRTHLRFLDGSIGILSWNDFFTVTLVDE